MWKEVTEFYGAVDKNPLVLVFASSVVLLVFALAGGVTYGNYLPLREVPAIVLAVIAFLLLIVSFVGLWIKNHNETRKIDAVKYGIKITQPVEGDVIDRITIRGSIEKLPEHYALRVFRRYPKINQFMPIGGPAIIKANNAAGEHYKLVQTHKDKIGEDAEYLSLITRKTSDMLECDRVSVKRK